MKVVYRKIKRPHLPKTADIEKFCNGFGSNALYVKTAVLLSLSISPDNERDTGSVLFYLRNPDLLFNVIDACEMWICGIIPEKSNDAGFEKILKCFRSAYPFRWQKKLILLSIDCKNEVMCYDDYKADFEHTANMFEERFLQSTKLSDII